MRKSIVLIVAFIICISWSTANDKPHQDPHGPHGAMADELWSSLNHWFFDEIKVYIEWFVTLFNHVHEYVGGAWHKLDVATDYFINYVREEDCEFMCPKGLDAVPNINYTSPEVGCTLFGFEVKFKFLIIFN